MKYLTYTIVLLEYWLSYYLPGFMSLFKKEHKMFMSLYIDTYHIVSILDSFSQKQQTFS